MKKSSQLKCCLLVVVTVGFFVSLSVYYYNEYSLGRIDQPSPKGSSDFPNITASEVEAAQVIKDQLNSELNLLLGTEIVEISFLGLDGAINASAFFIKGVPSSEMIPKVVEFFQKKIEEGSVERVYLQIAIDQKIQSPDIEYFCLDVTEHDFKFTFP